MNHFLIAALFGAVQGLAEFLPISSSGHLVLLHALIKLPVENKLAFDVALHAGTLVAVVIYFWRDLWNLLKGALLALRGRVTPDGRLAGWLILATIPGAALGYFFSGPVEDAIRRPVVVLAVLGIGGLALWAVDRWSAATRSLDQLAWGATLAIGFGQALALVPGVSRSGATIMIARAAKMTRLAAARFSFLLSVPIIAGAAAAELPELLHSSGQELQLSLVGAITAAIVGFAAIGFLMRYITTRTYAGFAIYRIAVSVIGLLILLLR